MNTKRQRAKDILERIQDLVSEFDDISSDIKSYASQFVTTEAYRHDVAEARRLAFMDAACFCKEKSEYMRSLPNVYVQAAELLDTVANEIASFTPVNKDGTNNSPILFPTVNGVSASFVALLDADGKELSRQPITLVTR
jgi:hypothetical protein